MQNHRSNSILFAGNRKEKCLNVKQSSKQCCKVREVAGKCKEGGKPALWGEDLDIEFVGIGNLFVKFTSEISTAPKPFLRPQKIWSLGMVGARL